MLFLLMGVITLHTYNKYSRNNSTCPNSVLTHKKQQLEKYIQFEARITEIKAKTLLQTNGKKTD